jgi:rubrerythrin
VEETIMTDKTLTDHSISPRSRRNLLDAMKGEAFAYAKYKVFAKQARERGHLDVAELFDKTADEEFFEHFNEEAGLLGLVGTDVQDLDLAITDESFEIDTMYKNYAQQAREDGDEPVAARFDEIRKDEIKHQLAFEEALIKLQTRERMTTSGPNRKAHDF